METENIDIRVVKATSIDQFKSPKGGRRLHMHYFLKMEEGSPYKWQYRWIDSHTDPDCLAEWIGQGRVYIFPSDGPVKEVG